MPDSNQLLYEPRHLAVFIAVAEELSLGRAAERLGTGHPAVSRLVAELESRLGATLLRCTTHSVSLTECGRRFLDGARDIVASFERSTATNRDLASGVFGKLVVSYMPIVAHTLVPRVVKACRCSHPEVNSSAWARRRGATRFGTGPWTPASPSVPSFRPESTGGSLAGIGWSPSCQSGAGGR